MRFKTQVLAATITSLWTAFALAQQPNDPLKAAVEKAVLTNPEVTSRFHLYRAAVDGIDVARAAYRPRVDLNASAGRDSDRITARSPEGQSLSRSGVALTLSQLLWDGLGTRSEVERLGHEKLTRYFELLEATEQTALEAARAYYDVQRFRRLVQLAEDNYVQHKYASLQIQSRFKAGVGRGVDLEQANARLALAESNLTTEIANLHDVTARYQRIVGEAPPAQMPQLAALTRGLPGNSEATMNAAIRQSPAVSASIENLRAARAAVQARKAPYQPRIEARVRSGAGNNFDGIRDQKRDSSAEIVLNWNLYNGGADAARVRQQTSFLQQAEDLRDKACRDTRQTAAIAHNDTRKLSEQVALLDRNTLAIEKARDAYRQQFDIGQRSLLDLLNSENELYTAKRAFANAEFDLALAYARVHGAMSQLTSHLGVSRTDAAVSEASGWDAGADAPARCPIVSSEVPGTDRSILDERARQIAASLAPAPLKAPAPAAAAASSPLTTPEPAAQSAPRPAPSTKAKTPAARKAPPVKKNIDAGALGA